jgi:15-cis-phytoene synthase
MGDVVAKSTEPTLGAVKLAWWRERLEELDEGKAPAEPRLQAAAAELLPRGIRGAALAELEGGWATVLEEEPDVERIAESGARLFALAASLLGDSHPLIAPAGRLFAYEQIARRGLMPMHWPMDKLHEISTHAFPKSLRPLTALAALAARDAKRGSRIESEGTPGRAMMLFLHRLNGRLPRP